MMKRAKKRIARDTTGLWIKVIGLMGAAGVVGLAAVFATLPFVRLAPPADNPGQYHTEMLAGRQYETTVRVQQDGAFEVRLSALAAVDAPQPLPSTRLGMRGGGMVSAPEIVQEKPGVFAVRGTLAMRGDWELTLTAAGQSAVIALPNNWSF